ncbi:MAG: ATP-binding cassette domain-containing protein, partial [Gammaproteobacteria bacterium]
VQSAIEAIGATDFIASLKNGLHEEIGVGGSRLSGGQKQLLGIVRIYLRSPKILLLDEATSSLDSESERKVQESLRRLKENRTTIVIAHRLATVSESKRIVLLKDGNVLAEGDHEYLNRNSALYRKYWQWQSRSGEQRVADEMAMVDAQ